MNEVESEYPGAAPQGRKDHHATQNEPMFQDSFQSILLLLCCAFCAACGGDPTTADIEKRQSSPEQPEVASDHRTPDLAPIVAVYDELRAALAVDDFPSAKRHAATLQRTAAAASLDTLAERAGRLSEQPADDAGGLRAEFSKVSESLVSTLAERPEVRTELFVFECPMVEGFGKWVQRSKDLQNPYMGKRMPTCGAGSTWES